MREKNNPDALPWDEIQKADYHNWRYSLDLGPIKQASSARINANPSFSVIRENAEWLSKQNDKEYTLNYRKYQEEQKEIRNRVKEIDSLNKTTNEIDVAALGDDLKKLQYDEGKSERFKQWIKNLRTDIYLDESVKVINDMIVQNNLVYNNRK